LPTAAFATVLTLAGQVACAQSPPDAAPADEFRSLLDAKEYEKAAAQALELVSAAEQQPGPGGADLQVALMNLALAQYLGEDYVGAETSYLRVIALIEASGHMTSRRLARAQAGLASTYFAGKRYDLAAARYEQAIALARREEGLFTEAQIPFLENYAAALTELNRIDDAQRAHRYILRTVERKYGAGSLRYAQELESLGRWYARIGAYDASRLALRDAIGIVEAAVGENAAELIGPLTALADCARRQLLDPAAARAESADEQRRSIMRDPMAPMVPMVSSSTLAAEGQEALERAVAIAGSQKPPSQLQVADVRTLLGDWYQSRQQPDKALANYQLAWQAGSGATTTSGKSVTELLFGRPVLLAYTPPGTWNRYAARPPEEVTLRSAQVSLTVTARGRVADPRVVSDAGDPKRGAQALRAAQSAIYRPRYAQGAPVDTPDVTIDQPFYVLVEKEDESAPAPDQSGG
jgi:tetratricopeptide (TPR) repeat protein